MGLDFRVCFAYAPPHPRTSALAEWRDEDAAALDAEELAKTFRANRRWYEP
ncbi:MAG: hypothetical protein M5R36_08010 [Deltaproteobacteria bacterium]|nr:hypothetical protein [Deltaproteobacteria bacterium]